MENDVKKILITEEEIAVRCKELGAQISKDYEGKCPIVVGLLKGSVPFLSELIKRITCEIEVDFMDVSSYAGTESTGEIKIVKDLDDSIKDRYILVVEDIVDTGRTLKTVKELLYQKKAKNVKIVSLLDKPSRRVAEIDVDYTGFVIPDEFVIGFGLDFNQKYRNLPFVGVLKEELYK